MEMVAAQNDEDMVGSDFGTDLFFVTPEQIFIV